MAIGAISLDRITSMSCELFKHDDSCWVSDKTRIILVLTESKHESSCLNKTQGIDVILPSNIAPIAITDGFILRNLVTVKGKKKAI